MLSIIGVTVKGIIRDRVLHGILMTALIFLFIPAISTLSMRQVTELSITLSLSLISFILLLLSVFLGGTSLWKDIDRRYTFSVLGLPVSRQMYVLGKYIGIASFVFFTAFVLGVVACLVVCFVSKGYPPHRPIGWGILLSAIIFDSFKYVLLVAVSFALSAVSTSFFLPVFGSIAIFLVGGATQQVYDYVHSSAGAVVAPFIKIIATILYYLLPNFTAFDLKVNAIYNIPLNINGLLFTMAYWSTYTGILMCLAIALYTRRELQ